MDDATFASLIQAHSRFPAAIEALLDDVDDDHLRRREAEGKWSPLEILVHLKDEEKEDFRLRAQAAAAQRPIDHPIDPQGWVTARSYNSQDPVAVLAELTAEREASCRWLRQIDAATWELGVEHERLGRMRCGDFIAAWRMHDLLHLRQLTTTLARLEGSRLAGWETRYAGDLP